jgi:hypothetical protein
MGEAKHTLDGDSHPFFMSRDDKSFFEEAFANILEANPMQRNTRNTTSYH